MKEWSTLIRIMPLRMVMSSYHSYRQLGFPYGRGGKGIVGGSWWIIFLYGRIVSSIWFLGVTFPYGRIIPSILLFLIKLMCNTYILNILLLCKCVVNLTDMIVNIIVHIKYTNSISTHT